MTEKDILEKALTEINKTYGKGTVRKMNETVDGVEVTPTGSLALDIALGVGGVPEGRIIEIYGPESSGKTTIACHILAESQKNHPDKEVLIIDAEHAIDRHYLENGIGVNMETCNIVQPDYGEQGLNIAEKLARTGMVSAILVDSVAALTPKSEIEGEIGDQKMGLQARMMSQAMRKLASVCNKTGTIMIFINQLREKIGVMFGCFPYTSKVKLSDGSTMSIGKIVNNKMPVEVMSWNDKEQRLEPKKVINWFNNGRYNQLIRVDTLSLHGSGTISMRVADDHTFITKSGDRRLSDMSVGDKILTTSKSYLNKDQMSLIIGGYLGDGSFRQKNKYTASYTETHGAKQNDYCLWKRNILSDFVSSEGYTGADKKYYFETYKTPELVDFKKGDSFESIVKNIDLKALAIWYLDDGSFSGSYEKWGKGKSAIYCTRFTESQKRYIQKHLEEKYGITCTVTSQGLLFSGDNNRIFQEKIARFCPKVMDYKLHPDLRGLCGSYTYDSRCEIRDILVEVPILAIENVKKIRSPYKYDIQVEGNSNYFVSGVLVHNSPETTTGGNALKFYSSIRLDVRREGKTETSKDGMPMSNNVKVRVYKNKVASPGLMARFKIKFGVGIDKYADILGVAEDLGIVDKKGSWYSYEGSNLAQGDANTEQMLQDNPELYEEILSKIREKLEI